MVVVDLECESIMMRFVVDVDAHITFAVPPCRREMHLVPDYSRFRWKIVCEQLYKVKR